LFLRQQGVPVFVLEASTEPALDMRASTFHPPTLDMLEADGVAAELMRQGTPVPRWQYRMHESGESIVFDMSSVAAFTRHPFRLQCEQWRLVRAVADRLTRDDDATLLMGARVTGLSTDGPGVCLEYSIGADARTIRADYVIAADGAGSTMRSLLNLPFEGDTYLTRSITVVLDCPFERYLPSLLPVNYCWTEDDRFSLMRVGELWRTGYSPRRGQSVEEALSNEYIAAHVQRVAGGNAEYRVVHKAAYTVHRRLLEHFRKGRVLFAGDAAHLNSPSGGMGMNSGIHDAYVLAGSVAAVLRGEPDQRLDDYDVQRHQVARDDIQQAADRHHNLHREIEPVQRRANWDHLKHVAADPTRMMEYLLGSSMIRPLLRYGVAPIPLRQGRGQPFISGESS